MTDIDLDEDASIGEPGERWHQICPKTTPWYSSYCQPENTSLQFQKTFRRRFGIHWWNYLEILEAVKADERFKTWFDPSKAKVAPVEMLVQTALRRYTFTHSHGRALDLLSDSTAIDESDIVAFDRSFQAFAATTLYDVYVKPTLVPKKRKRATEEDVDESAQVRMEMVAKFFLGKQFHEVK